MKHSLKIDSGKWLVIGTLILLMTITSIGNVSAATLTDADAASLKFMREEEKLARDVYSALYEKWKLPLFSNIAKSEQTHMNAIKTLLDRYNIPDSASSEAGKFNDPSLAALYTDLIEKGNLSLINALEVGETIEEADIDDLVNEINSTGLRDIKRVYSNLMQGSLSHLKAFVSNLALLGVVFE